MIINFQSKNCKYEDVLLLNISTKYLAENQSLWQCYLAVMDKKPSSVWTKDILVVSPSVYYCSESPLEEWSGPTISKIFLKLKTIKWKLKELKLYKNRTSAT